MTGDYEQTDKQKGQIRKILTHISNNNQYQSRSQKGQKSNKKFTCIYILVYFNQTFNKHK